MAESKWMLAEDIPRINFFFCQIWLRAFVNDLKNSCGLNYDRILGVFNGFDMSFYYDEADCLKHTRHLVKKLGADPSFGDEINCNIVHCSDELLASAQMIPKDLTSLSNAALYAILEEHSRVHTKLYEWGWLSNAMDMFHPELTDLLKNYLRSKLGSEAEVNAAFVTLTTPLEKSEDAKQHEELLGLALSPSEEKIAEYYAKYAPISALWVEEPAPLSSMREEITHLQLTAKQELDAIKKKAGKLKAEQTELLEKLQVDEQHEHLFKVFGGFMISKPYRRHAQLRANYLMRPVFREIARRFGITEMQAHFMLAPEYKQLLVDGSFDTAQLAERAAFCVLYSEEGKDEVFVGSEAKKRAAAVEQKHDLGVSEVKGQCACLGFARGRVKIVLSPADLWKMQKGDILVAIATNPDVVPAMKKAAAIVTEQGGVTCHAAIVSREMGIPCVIGTRIATKWLKDGDLIEVDATKGLVKKL
ncbi:MAG: PEP-utilizing enzyme [Candidatus Micrarchaeota archaeon]